MKYRTIVADPPWPYATGTFKKAAATGHDQSKSHPTFAGVGRIVRREQPYPVMPMDAIAMLPVATLADPTGARLFLWTTNTYLRDAFDILRGWGFAYGQTLVWHKLGCAPWPTAVAPNSAEFLLVGIVGSPGRLASMPSAVIAHGVPKEHSRKPDVFIDLIESISPGPRVELFSRRHRLGWDVWGDQSANTATLGPVA